MGPKTTRSVMGLALVVASMCLLANAAQNPQESSQAPATTASNSLTNDDILKMVEGKLADALIIAKIKSSSSQFDTTIDALIQLKQAGVSDAVMQAMTEAGAAVASIAAAPSQPEADPNDPLAPHDPGIYLIKTDREGERMVQLEPTAYSQGKTGGMFKSAMTYGLAKSQWKAVIRGGKANARITEPRPTFYFHFEGKQGTPGFSSPWMGMFGGISSPNQFVLAKFDAKKDSRELVVGEWGATGSSMGTRGKDIVEFDFEKLASGVYKVIPRTDLQPGEYCFFAVSTNMAYGASGGSLFDFGINPAQ